MERQSNWILSYWIIIFYSNALKSFFFFKKKESISYMPAQGRIQILKKGRAQSKTYGKFTFIVKKGYMPTFDHDPLDPPIDL